MSATILIARIRRPHGIRGEVICDAFTFDPHRFAKLKEVTLRAGEEKILTIERSRPSEKGVIIKFKEIADRNEAELLRDYEIFIDESERLPLDKDEVYLDDMIGMEVLDDATGEKIGKVRDVLEYPAGAVYEFEMNDGSEKLVHSKSGEVRTIEKRSKKLRVSFMEEL